MAAATLNFFLIFLSVVLFSQTGAQQTAAPPPPPASDACNGVFLTYTVTKNQKIAPDLKTDPTRQPYRFESTLSVLNNGLDEIKAWRVFVGFRRRELLVSASGAVLADGSTFPAEVGNGTVFAGFPSSDLKTAIETAGDLTQMGVQVELVGTQFGVASPDVPMPANISLVNDGWICPRPAMQGKSVMQVCCTPDPDFIANTTLDGEFLPRQTGDLTIMYDVTRTYETDYWADVSITNHNPLGRLDNWKLSWDWMRDEFIFEMKGAYPSIVDTSDCVFGKQGQHYKDMDFSTALSCEKRPTIVDLPLEKANDTVLGMVKNCCRNGTILPPSMDPSKSVSVFQIHVFKMPPDLNRSGLTPPANFQINGTLNPDYKCGPAVRVSPSEFPDPSGLLSSKAAVASWQVVCNITQPKGASPRCCVSFSAYYNDSVIPCPTCACGCPASTSRTCSATKPAMLLPPDASLKPFENRTILAKAWASIHHLPVPNPLPCPDNCGVSLNWHLASDYRGGWSARITIFNWDEFAFPDWFAAVELPKTGAGFEKVYSFNGSALAGVNNTVIMQGLKDMNYLVPMADAPNPAKDPPIPGKQQSVLSFSKKNIPGVLDIPRGDGFPSKVFFNGEECALPRILPSSGAHRSDSSGVVGIILAFVVMVLLQQ